MAQPYVGEIRMFGGNFAPAGWELCDGRLLPISENETLFQLIGTTYGGDGESTFGLPDLQGRLPLHMGSGFVLGQAAGVEEVTLTVQQIPSHAHGWLATTSAASANTPVGNIPAVAQGDLYTTSFSPTNMHVQAISPTGGSQPHTNFQPYLCITFIISLYGIFPSPT